MMAICTVSQPWTTKAAKRAARRRAKTAMAAYDERAAVSDEKNELATKWSSKALPSSHWVGTPRRL
jgi:hypothetical protein